MPDSIPTTRGHSRCPLMISHRAFIAPRLERNRPNRCSNTASSISSSVTTSTRGNWLSPEARLSENSLCARSLRSCTGWCLKKMYQPEVYYQKAGVMLSELVPQGGQQADLFAYSSTSNKSGRLMVMVDGINSKYRRSTIHLASEGVDRTWSMRRSFKSPNYTEDWNELPAAAACSNTFSLWEISLCACRFIGDS